MKSRILTWLTAMTLFALLTLPFELAAQEPEAELRHNKEHHRYKLVDIGTFGGPASFINPAGNGGPYISRRGTAVGSSATSIPSDPATHFFYCGGGDGNLPFTFHAFDWQGGDVTDLGALPSAVDSCSVALAVNSRGEIAGGSENGVLDPVLGIRESRAVLWKDGKIKNLGTLGGNHSQATAINDNGQIVGYALNKIPDPFSILDGQFGGSSNGTQTRAFLWEGGHMKDLGTLGGPDAFGVFVNQRGEVAGFSYTNSIPSASGFPTQDPFLWTRDKGMIDLGTLGGNSGSPTGLNHRGQVIGSSNLAGNQASDPFLWEDGKLIDLNVQSSGAIVTANAINDAGEIVGNAGFPNGASDTYLWKDGVAIDLGTLAGDCFSEAFAINSSDQVVGFSFSCTLGTTRSFLWEHGSMVDLNTLIPRNSDLQLDNTFAISDRGEIAGLGLPSGCSLDTQCGHAYLLVPCDNDALNEEGCEEGAETTIAVKSAPVSQSQASAEQSRVTAREVAARIHSRLVWRRSFGVLPPK